jgi:hypothetical protein
MRISMVARLVAFGSSRVCVVSQAHEVVSDTFTLINVRHQIGA